MSKLANREVLLPHLLLDAFRDSVTACVCFGPCYCNACCSLCVRVSWREVSSHCMLQCMLASISDSKAFYLRLRHA